MRLLSFSRTKKPYKPLIIRPVIIDEVEKKKPRIKIEVRQLGLATGKLVRVRIGGRRRQINVYYKETS